ncbi:MAG: glycerol-3-phosphate acyltransferase [Firmicutes bacterium]|nr:glycerol-3-phosphate acyltransferase [Bacillota bacterium]
MRVVIAAILGYVLGSISTGVILGRVFAGKDIRSIGSGNTGASNAARVLGIKLGVLVAGGDVAKGMLATVAGGLIAHSQLGAAAGGAAAVIGHILPIWHGFRGGKAIATFFGSCVILAPAVTPVAALAWGVAFGACRSIPLASAIASACLPVFGWALAEPWPAVLYLTVSGYAISARHIPDVVGIRQLTPHRRP